MKSVSKNIDSDDIYQLATASGAESLDRAARDRVIAEEVEARFKLEADLRAFLIAMRANAETLLGRNPVSGDLLPFFEEYAKSIFDALAQEYIATASSLPKKIEVLHSVFVNVHDLICSGKTGVWFRTVHLACDPVGLCSWSTHHGEYSRSTLLVPQRAMLAARLRSHALSRAVTLAKSTAGKSEPVPSGKHLISTSYRPRAVSEATRRAQHVELLRSIKEERHWTMEQLAARCKLSISTIKNIFQKRKVGASSLEAIETNLSFLLGRAVHML